MDFEIHNFKQGDRVQLHPATDLWMRGARYGDVVKVGRALLTVKLDAIAHPKTFRIHPRNIGEIL